MIEEYKALLSDFLKYKSISTNVTYATEIQKTVLWLKTLFESKNFTVEIVNNYGNPLISASHIENTDFKTTLIYGHYDVQPASIEDGWDNDPFELQEKDNRLLGRGVIDNKGQVLVHIYSIFKLIQEKKLKYNIKFILEGNEETGSPKLESFINKYKEKLQADLIMISDGEIMGKTPIIELGFRGGFNATLNIKTAKNDLHSGIYGGIAPNAALELSKILSKLIDDKNKITIKDFYNNVDPINENNTQFDEEEYFKITETKAIIKEEEYDPLTQVGLRPTIQITGMNSGYTDEGYRNSIPCSASAKINFRLVKSQNPNEIIGSFKNFLKENIPSYLEYDIDCSDPYEGVKLNNSDPCIVKAEKILELSFKTTPIHKYSGGGLPIVTYFNNIFDCPQILVPLANEDCNMHGVNENYDINILNYALNFSYQFFSTD